MGKRLHRVKGYRTIRFFFRRSNAQLPFHTRHVHGAHQRGVRQTALAVRSLLGQDVALEGMLALDLASSRQLESLLGAGLGLHFGHEIRIRVRSYLGNYFVFLGWMIMNIRLPSKWGRASTFPRCSRSWAKRNNKISPCSLYTMDRPRKNT